MLDLVETEIETLQICEFVEAFDVADEVIVEVEFDERLRDVGGERDPLDLILSETETLAKSAQLHIDQPVKWVHVKRVQLKENKEKRD